MENASSQGRAGLGNIGSELSHMGYRQSNLKDDYQLGNTRLEIASSNYEIAHSQMR